MIFRVVIYLFGNTFNVSHFATKFESEVSNLDCYNDAESISSASFVVGQEFCDNISYDDAIDEIIKFIKKNKKYLIEIGVDDFRLMTEVFYMGTQCNFELFNQHYRDTDELKNFSTPVSTYRLNRKVYKNLMNTMIFKKI